MLVEKFLKVSCSLQYFMRNCHLFITCTHHDKVKLVDIKAQTKNSQIVGNRFIACKIYVRLVNNLQSFLDFFIQGKKRNFESIVCQKFYI